MLASEASQENFEKNCVYNHKIWANSETRTFALPKSGGGGGTNPLVPPTFESREASAPLPPFSYALAFYETYLHITALRDTVRAAITTFDFKMII